jgi:hypothetical protein
VQGSLQCRGTVWRRIKCGQLVTGEKWPLTATIPSSRDKGEKKLQELLL